MAIFSAAGGELEIAAADEIKATGIFTLREERRLGGKRNCAGGKFKISQDGASQGAEPAWAAIGASCATSRNLPGHVPLPHVWFYRNLRIRHGLAPSDSDATPSIPPSPEPRTLMPGKQLT